MPFVGVDPWRWQYFEGVAVPDDLVIPCDDPTGWRLYPRYRYVYNKLFICASQRIPNGPHGVVPERCAVFSKPGMNLQRTGVAGRVLGRAPDLEVPLAPRR